MATQTLALSQVTSTSTSTNTSLHQQVFGGLTSSETTLIIAAPFIVTAIIVAILVLVRRSRAKRPAKKREPELGNAPNPQPVQMVDNAPRRPEPAATIDERYKNVPGGWRDIDLGGSSPGSRTASPRRNPWNMGP